MGAEFSSFEHAENNSHVERFISAEPLSLNDPFWNNFVSFQVKGHLSVADVHKMERQFKPHCSKLAENGMESKNVFTLGKLIVRRIEQLKEDEGLGSQTMFCCQLYNALFIYRIVAKYLVDYEISEERVMRILDDTVANGGNIQASIELHEVTGFTEFLFGLVEFCNNVAVRPLTYAIHYEILSLFLVLLSQQASRSLSEIPVVFHLLLAELPVDKQRTFYQTLFIHIADSSPYKVNYKRPRSAAGTVFSALFSVLTLGAGPYLFPGNTLADDVPLLADQSLSVLLVLAYQSKELHQGKSELNSSADAEQTSLVNTASLQYLLDTTSNGNDETSGLNLAAIYQRICKRFGQLPDGSDSALLHSQKKKADQLWYALLFYFLLHRSEPFRNFVLSRTDLDAFMMPLLRSLLSPSAHSTSHENGPKSDLLDVEQRHQAAVNHVYVSLVILLMLTEDSQFCQALNTIYVTPEPWLRSVDEKFKPKSLPDSINLMSFSIYVLVRCIQMNLNVAKDRYLYTNCLATLANLSSHFSAIDNQVSAKLVSLIKQLMRSYQRLMKRIDAAKFAARGITEPDPSAVTTTIVRPFNDASDRPTTSAQSSRSRPSSSHVIVTMDEKNALETYHITEEVLRMLYEILNNALTQALRKNANLVYAMLYEKELFLQAASVHGVVFNDVVQNTVTVLQFLDRVLAESPVRPTSFDESVVVVQEHLLKFKVDSLHRLADLKFRYVEQPQPEQFFLPYVWALVVNSSQLAFRRDRLKLVTAQRKSTFNADDELTTV